MLELQRPVFALKSGESIKSSKAGGRSNSLTSNLVNKRGRMARCLITGAVLQAQRPLPHFLDAGSYIFIIL